MPTCDLRSVNNNLCEQYILKIYYLTDTVIKHVTWQTKRGEWQKCFKMLLETIKFWLSLFSMNNPLGSQSDLNSCNLLLVWYVSLIFSTSPPEIWRDKCDVIILNNSNDLNSIWYLIIMHHLNCFELQFELILFFLVCSCVKRFAIFTTVYDCVSFRCYLLFAIQMCVVRLDNRIFKHWFVWGLLMWWATYLKWRSSNPFV